MLLTSGIAREAVFAGREDVLGRVSRRQSGRWQLQDTTEMMRRGGWQAPPRPVPVGGDPSTAADDSIARLRELAALRGEGALTADEFSAQKARILAGG